jgi:hypothetical protein
MRMKVNSFALLLNSRRAPFLVAAMVPADPVECRWGRPRARCENTERQNATSYGALDIGNI